MFRRPLALLLALSLGPMAPASDWPMLGRNGTRNAVSPETRAPTEWQLEIRDQAGAIKRPARHVKWVAQLGSRSLGGPVIAGGLVWVGTNNAHPRAIRSDRDGKPGAIDMSVLLCFREADGRFLWQYASPRLGVYGQDGPGSSMGTPLVEGDHLWLTTNRCETLCLDIGPLRDGSGPPREKWKRDLRKEFGVFPKADVMSDGLAPSPVADAERVFVGTRNGVDGETLRLPAPDAPSLVAFDKRTGATVWTDASPGRDIMDSQLSSPLLLQAGGRTQVVVGQGDGWLRAFEAKTGRLIWKCDLNPKGAKFDWRLASPRGGRNYVMATPIACDGYVYIAPGRSPEYQPGEADLFCIGPTGAGDVSAEVDDGQGGGRPNPNTRVVWKFGGPAPKGYERDRLFGRCLGSCVAHDGLVYACDFEGWLHCLDAKTGRLYWWHDLKDDAWCGPLWADGKIYVANADGAVCIFAHGREKKLLTTVEIDEPIRVTPVYANGTLYVATQSRLFAIQAAP
jgi:outer membrane protein assembly factor BamB